MPTLDDLDVIISYLEDRDLYCSSLYHRSKKIIRPKAPRYGPCIWIVKDGKPVIIEKEGKDE